MQELWGYGKLILLIFLGLFISCNAFAQTFNNEEELIEQANKFFTAESFTQAKPLFSQLLSLHPEVADYNYKFGVCKLYTDADKNEALTYLEAAAGIAGVSNEAFYYLGKGYHLNFKFDAAITQYNKYQSGLKGAADDKEVDRQIAMCKNGRQLFDPDLIFFPADKSKTIEGEFYRKYDQRALKGKIIPKADNFKSKYDKKINDNSLMFVSQLSRELYFSGYGEEGATGSDIYRVYKLPNGEWAIPQRLPDVINTEFDEAYAFMHPEGDTLYFSSKGHNTMGGFDIFMSIFDRENGSWSKPVNMRYPYCTPDDDLFYATEYLRDFSYFATRNFTEPGKITVFKVSNTNDKDALGIVSGYFSMGDTMLTKAQITVADKESGELIGIYNSNKVNGKYLLSLPKGKVYIMTVEPEGFVSHRLEVKLPSKFDVPALSQKIIFSKASEGEKVVMVNGFDGAGNLVEETKTSLYSPEQLNVESKKQGKSVMSLAQYETFKKEKKEAAKEYLNSLAAARASAKEQMVSDEVETGQAKLEGKPKQATEEKAKQEELAKVEAAKKQAEEEEKARIAAEEAKRVAEERAKQEELAKAEAAKKQAEEEEKARIAAEKAKRVAEEKAKQEELAKAEAAKKQAEEEEKARIAAEEAKRVAEEKAKQEELAKAEAAKKQAEEEEKARIVAEEAKKVAEEKAKQEELAKAEAAKKQAEEEEKARIVAEKAKRVAEEKAKQEELAKVEAAKKQAEEEEKARIAAEKAKRVAEEKAEQEELAQNAKPNGNLLDEENYLEEKTKSDEEKIAVHRAEAELKKAELEQKEKAEKERLAALEQKQLELEEIKTAEEEALAEHKEKEVKENESMLKKEKENKEAVNKLEGGNSLKNELDSLNATLTKGKEQKLELPATEPIAKSEEEKRLEEQQVAEHLKSLEEEKKKEQELTARQEAEHLEAMKRQEEEEALAEKKKREELKAKELVVEQEKLKKEMEAAEKAAAEKSKQKELAKAEEEKYKQGAKERRKFEKELIAELKAKKEAEDKSREEKKGVESEKEVKPKPEEFDPYNVVLEEPIKLVELEAELRKIDEALAAAIAKEEQESNAALLKRINAESRGRMILQQEIADGADRTSRRAQDVWENRIVASAKKEEVPQYFDKTDLREHEGVHFKIEVVLKSAAISGLAQEKITASGQLLTPPMDEFVVYTTGYYKTLADITLAKSDLRDKGITDFRVIAYHNDDEIPVSEVKSIPFAN